MVQVRTKSQTKPGQSRSSSQNSHSSSQDKVTDQVRTKSQTRSGQSETSKDKVVARQDKVIVPNQVSHRSSQDKIVAQVRTGHNSSHDKVVAQVSTNPCRPLVFSVFVF